MSNVFNLTPGTFVADEGAKLPPPDTKRDRAYLASVARLAPLYGYKLDADPTRRRPMPFRLMWDLGFRHAAIEMAKQQAARDRRAQWAARRA